MKQRQDIPHSRADVEVLPDLEEVEDRMRMAMQAVDACSDSADPDMSAAMRAAQAAATAAASASILVSPQIIRLPCSLHLLRVHSNAPRPPLANIEKLVIMSVPRCAHNDSLMGLQTAVPAVLGKVIRTEVPCRPGAIMRLPACGSWAALA